MPHFTYQLILTALVPTHKVLTVNLLTGYMYNFININYINNFLELSLTFSTISPATPRTTSNRLFGEKFSGSQNATSL